MSIWSNARIQRARPNRSAESTWASASARRETDRIPFEGRATIRVGDRRIQSSTGDLSEAGAFVHTSMPPGVGETVLFTVRMDGGLTVATEATVVWIDTDDEGHPTGCGLAFVRLSPTTRLAISTRLRSQEATPVQVEEVADAEQRRPAGILHRWLARMAG